MYDRTKGTLFFYPSGKKASKFTVPENVRCIAQGAFNQCNYLESLILPGNHMAIQVRGIENCEALRSVSLYGKICKLDYSAIDYCPSLRIVKIYGMTTKLRMEEDGEWLSAITHCGKVTIYARKGSKAEKYAKKHRKFKFAAL